MNSESSTLRIQSLIKSSGELEVSLVRISRTAPDPDEVVVQIEASPINPSDLGLLFGAADMGTAVQSGTKSEPIITAKIPSGSMGAMAGRVGKPLFVGNEGAGTIIAAGPNNESLIGKTVSVLGAGMYSQTRKIKAKDCIILKAGTSAAEGASFFINPLTSLGMIETMRREGHKALLNTAAASNLGQMLNRVCIKENIGLVNIVRKESQTETLRALGAKYICDSSKPDFQEKLTAALKSTGATIAFDAIGGGNLAGIILECMERALISTSNIYSRYGSSAKKQIYVYGGLNLQPTTLSRRYGMAWSIGSWLLPAFQESIGTLESQKMKDRVLSELTTTFASHYTREISLAEALDLNQISAYNKRITGEKYLINPNK